MDFDKSERERYVQLLGKEALIWRKGKNSGRRATYGSAARPIRGSRSIRKLVHESKPPVFARSRNNFAWDEDVVCLNAAVTRFV